MSPCIILGFTLKTFSTYSNYLQTSDAILSFFAPSDFNDDDFYFSNYLQLLEMQAEVQDGKYILLAILKGFLWVYT